MHSVVQHYCKRNIILLLTAAVCMVWYTSTDGIIWPFNYVHGIVLHFTAVESTVSLWSSVAAECMIDPIGW